MSCFSMRENRHGKTPEQWLPLPWERDGDYDVEPPISEEDRQELVNLMGSINTQDTTTQPANSKSDEP